MTGPVVEHRRLRGPTLAADRLRRAAIEERAATAERALQATLEGLDREFVFAVFRCIIRSLAARLVDLGDAARSVGVLAGAQAEVAPAYRPARAEARAKGEAAFAKRAA